MWKTLAAIVLSTLPLRGCDQHYSCGNIALESMDGAASPEAIFQVLRENCAAANAEDVDRYMKTFHPDCPDFNSRRFAFEYVCTKADLASRIVHMRILGLESNEAHVLYMTRTEKLRGPSYLEGNILATQLVTLRRNESVWRVYKADPIPEGYISMPR